MDRRTIATVLGFIGVLFFMAMAFGLMPSNYAMYAGIAFCMAAGLTWSIMRQKD
jgi:hypothetical protein